MRIALEGNAREVREAKKKLGLYLGTQRMVVDMNKDEDNIMLFLVPSGAGHVELRCGDGCTPLTIIDLPRLRSNTLYSGKVHYVPAEEMLAPAQGPRAYSFTLQVELKDAKVEIIYNNAKQERLIR